MTRVIEAMEEPILNNNPSPISPRKNSDDISQAPMARVHVERGARGRELVGDSLWLSKKMIDDGCSLEQTLDMMEERCKDCDTISPMLCVEQCGNWSVKKELKETNTLRSENNHRIKLLNAIKNPRRIAMLNVLCEHPLPIESLQKKLRTCGFSHSQDTISAYLKPLTEAGLVKQTGTRIGLTLYGRKVNKAVVRHGFSGQLPIHSKGQEETILKSLLEGKKTRAHLLRIISGRSLSRIMKRLLERKLISQNSFTDRVFYFRTKRALQLERLSPTQRRICDVVPEAGISARALSRKVGINMRRTYKYLRNLRGKKLVFRRRMPIHYELTLEGRMTAEFLDEIAHIE
jgi:DNA-binding transcriptional ArsR family regulator/predicted transcriptional regulator